MGRLKRALGAALAVAVVTAEAIACTVIASSIAHAETEQDREIVLVLASLPEDLDAESVRAAIEREVGGHVALGEAANDRATLTLRVREARRVLLSYRAPDGRVTEREVDLPDERARAVEIVAYLAGNLIRDEASELAAALRKHAPEPPPLPPPLVAPAPSVTPAPAKSGCSSDGRPEHFFGFDVVPFVGTSSVTGITPVHRLAINVVGGISGGLRGFELGGALNLETGFACGVQLSGGANVVLGPVVGLQWANGANVAGSMSGAQVALVDVALGEAEGAQIGVVNLARRSLRGLQLGLVNVAHDSVKGAQLGLVNVASRSSFSLGLVSIVRDGRTHLDIWGQESGILMAGVKHGGDHFHNIYGFGVRPFGEDGRWVFALGVGGHFPVTSRLFLDLDTIFYTLHDTQKWSILTTLVQERLVLGVRIVNRFAIYVGPTYDIGSTGTGTTSGTANNGPLLAPYSPNFTLQGSQIVVKGWVGGTLGVQIF